MPKLLIESAASGLTRSGKRWAVTLAVPGQGSSGFYSEDVFRDYGAAAIPPGTRAYIGHPTEANPTRNQKDLLGTYPDGGVWNAEAGKFESELEPLPHWEAWLDAVAPHSALSIHMMAESDEAGNVTSFIPHIRNTVDLVDYPGLAGSGFDAKVESLFDAAHAIAASSKPGSEASVQISKEGSMDKEIKEAFEGLTGLLTTFIASQTVAAEAAAQAEASAAAAAVSVESALKAYNEKVVAIEAAKDLLPSQIVALKAEALKGNDVTAAIEAQSAIAIEAVAAAVAKGTPAPVTESYSTGFSLGAGNTPKLAAEALPKGW